MGRTIHACRHNFRLGQSVIPLEDGDCSPDVVNDGDDDGDVGASESVTRRTSSGVYSNFM